MTTSVKECIAEKNPPRLVVEFREGMNGQEEFQWGIVGKMPILSLISFLASVQYKLINLECYAVCDEKAFVMIWDEEFKQFHWYLHREIPVNTLIGMLEVIKSILVNSRMAQHMGANCILGPQGDPMRRI